MMLLYHYNNNNNNNNHDYYYNRYYYKREVSSTRVDERECILSVRRPQPHTTNPRKEENEKIAGDEKKEQINNRFAVIKLIRYFFYLLP